eukprot:GHVH01003052.1.p1 GENE.GHVH01003052.1~~GHVH01003052.1.p1  ORF type:complete len:737 (+),score=110.97 GHVH01003052.1:579-2789(+)
MQQRHPSSLINYQATTLQTTNMINHRRQLLCLSVALVNGSIPAVTEFIDKIGESDKSLIALLLSVGVDTALICRPKDAIVLAAVLHCLEQLTSNFLGIIAPIDFLQTTLRLAITGDLSSLNCALVKQVEMLTESVEIHQNEGLMCGGGKHVTNPQRFIYHVTLFTQAVLKSVNLVSENDQNLDEADCIHFLKRLIEVCCRALVKVDDADLKPLKRLAVVIAYRMRSFEEVRPAIRSFLLQFGELMDDREEQFMRTLQLAVFIKCHDEIGMTEALNHLFSNAKAADSHLPELMSKLCDEVMVVDSSSDMGRTSVSFIKLLIDNLFSMNPDCGSHYALMYTMVKRMIQGITDKKFNENQLTEVGCLCESTLGRIASEAPARSRDLDSEVWIRDSIYNSALRIIKNSDLESSCLIEKDIELIQCYLDISVMLAKSIIDRLMSEGLTQKLIVAQEEYRTTCVLRVTSEMHRIRQKCQIVNEDVSEHCILRALTACNDAIEAGDLYEAGKGGSCKSVHDKSFPLVAMYRFECELFLRLRRADGGILTQKSQDELIELLEELFQEKSPRLNAQCWVVLDSKIHEIMETFQQSPKSQWTQDNALSITVTIKKLVFQGLIREPKFDIRRLCLAFIDILQVMENGSINDFTDQFAKAIQCQDELRDQVDGDEEIKDMIDYIVTQLWNNGTHYYRVRCLFMAECWMSRAVQLLPLSRLRHQYNNMKLTLESCSTSLSRTRSMAVKT